MAVPQQQHTKKFAITGRQPKLLKFKLAQRRSIFELGLMGRCCGTVYASHESESQHPALAVLFRGVILDGLAPYVSRLRARRAIAHMYSHGRGLWLQVKQKLNQGFEEDKSHEPYRTE
jgi:hypothetical protein